MMIRSNNIIAWFYNRPSRQAATPVVPAVQRAPKHSASVHFRVVHPTRFEMQRTELPGVPKLQASVVRATDGHNDPMSLARPSSNSPSTTGSWLEKRMMWKVNRSVNGSAASGDGQFPSGEGTPYALAPGAAKHASKRNGMAQRRRSSFFSHSRKAMIDGSKSMGNGNFWGGSTIVRIKTQRNGDHVPEEAPVHIPDESLLNDISEEDLKAPVLVLGQLPQEFAEIMRRYDLDGNGTLDREDSIHAAADLGRMRHQIEQGIVHISAFPEYAQPMLAEHDIDGDGTLDVSEMIIAFQALERERQQRRMWMRLTLAAVIFIAVLVLALSGVLYYVVNLLRDADVEEGGQMVVKDTNLTVQTASLELAISNGRLVERNAANKCAGDQECPLQVAEAKETMAVSSEVSDHLLGELKALKITDGVSWVLLRVFAVQRLPDADSTHGSILLVYSHLGEVELDGTRLKLHSKLSDVLARAGIEVPPGQDTLESGAGGDLQLLGTFNSLDGAR